MPKFRKKPVVVEAVQWWKIGDDADVVFDIYELDHLDHESCGYCEGKASVHGWIATAEGGHIVCPGDWIITGVKGERYPCKPDIFRETYDYAD